MADDEHRGSDEEVGACCANVESSSLCVVICEMSLGLIIHSKVLKKIEVEHTTTVQFHIGIKETRCLGGQGCEQQSRLWPCVRFCRIFGLFR